MIPTNATNKSITWVSSNPSVGTITSGTFVAISAGTTTITAISNGCGQSASVNVTVNDKKIPVVSIESKDMELEVDSQKQISYTVKPINAINKSVSFESSNDLVAYIDQTGTVSGLSAGTAIITITSVENPTIKKQINVNVSSKIVYTQVTFNMAPSTTDYTNDSVKLNLATTGDIDYIDFGNGNKFNGAVTEYTVYENGEYIFTVHGKGGDSASQIVHIANIDRVVPTLRFSYGLGFKSVKVAGNDNKGLKGIYFPNSVFDTSTESTVDYPIVADTDYGTVMAEDLAGNTTEKDIFIKTSGGSGAIVYQA